MAVDFLSIFIIVIFALGIFGLALIFWRRKNQFDDQSMKNTHFKEKNSQENHSSETTTIRSRPVRMRIEPTVFNSSSSDSAISSLGFSTFDVLQDQKASVTPAAKNAVVPVTEPPVVAAAITAAPANKELILFYLLASPEHPFSGYELLQSLLSAGLHYGKMNVFHRHENEDGSGEVLFSLASAVEPGIFDLNNIGGFSCPGLSLFMLPNKTKDSIATFELMLQTANQLAEDLGGNLFDDERKPLTEHAITQMRLLLQSADE